MIKFLCAVGLLLSMALQSHATELPPATGPVLLEVSGLIDNTNFQDKARLDNNILKSWPQADFIAQTYWTDGEHEFSGFLARDMINALGASGRTVKAVAQDGYSTDIPFAVLESTGALFAMQMDGKPMQSTGRGAIWLVFPELIHKDYPKKQFRNFWVWQLKALSFR
ncbi:MAG: hypothetical protein ACI8P9_002357 [Parasphingorhabdus sp.]|jgi:hypothetical protein